MSNQLKKTDPIHSDMVVYFNFILDDFATEYTRKHYTLIDLFEEMGGLIKQFALIAILLMKPFTFMRHDLLVFENHAKSHKMKKYYDYI